MVRYIHLGKRHAKQPNKAHCHASSNISIHRSKKPPTIASVYKYSTCSIISEKPSNSLGLIGSMHLKVTIRRLIDKPMTDPYSSRALCARSKPHRRTPPPLSLNTSLIPPSLTSLRLQERYALWLQTTIVNI